MLVVHDVLHALQEPRVNLGELVDTVHGIAFFQCLCNGEDTQVGRILQFLVQIVKLGVVIAHESVHALTNHTETFLNQFLETTSDGHDFTYRLHAGTNLAAHTGKLGQVPTRNLADEVIQGWSHVCRVSSSHLTNLVQGIAQGNLGSHEGQWVTRSLGSQGRRTGQTGIYLDDSVVVCLSVEGELDVALAHDVQVAHATDGDILQVFHLVLSEGAGRSHYNGLTCVDAQRVEVLHGSHGEAVVVRIADALELDFLPSLEALFHQHLRCKGEGTLCYFYESLLIGADTGTQATQCIGRTDHDRVADAACSCDGIFHGLTSLGYRNLEVYLVQLLDEEVAVLSVHDGFHAGTQHLYAVLLQNTFLEQFGTTVQCSLSTESQQDAVRAFLLNNFGNKKGIDRQEINFVRNTFTSLNCSNVGVDEHRLDAFLSQGFEGLTTGIVEFSCLSNLQGA